LFEFDSFAGFLVVARRLESQRDCCPALKSVRMAFELLHLQ
jgi:hypothetical protein